MWILFLLLALVVAVGLVMLQFQDKLYLNLKPGEVALIYRFGVYHHTIHAEQAAEKIVWPVLEQARHILNCQKRRIVLPYSGLDDGYKIKLNLQIEYKIDLEQARKLAGKIIKPVPEMVDFVQQHVPVISSHLPKNKPDLYKSTLAQELQEQLSFHMQAFAFSISKLVLLEAKILEQKTYDMSATTKIMELLQVQHENDDASWWEDFCANILKAHFIFAGEEIQPISPSLKACIVVPWSEQQEDVEPVAVKDIFDHCLEFGVGFAITQQAGEEPKLVLSFMEIYAIAQGQYQELILQQSIPTGPFYKKDSEFIPMGKPSHDLLPPVIMHGLNAYLKQLHIEQPKVVLLAQMGGDLAVSVAFNVFREQFSTDEDFESFTRQFYWYLPHNIPLFGISAEDPVAAEMVPLADL